MSRNSHLSSPYVNKHITKYIDILINQFMIKKLNNMKMTQEEYMSNSVNDRL